MEWGQFQGTALAVASREYKNLEKDLLKGAENAAKIRTWHLQVDTSMWIYFKTYNANIFLYLMFLV